MSKPVIFDDICKKTTDILNDDYFVGTKMTMKVKHIDGINLTAEAKTSEGKPVVSKISGDFAPCDYCNVKKLSIESTGALVADVDVTKVIKKTTLMMRTQKNYNECGMKKASFGAKVMTDVVAFDSSFDVVSQRYNAGVVYGIRDALIGAKVSGGMSSKPVVDVAMSYSYDRIVCSCVGFDLFKRADVAILYELDKKTRLSAVCKVKSLESLPEMTVGFVSKIADNTEVRAKVNCNGELSSCFKTTVDNKMTFSGAMTVDTKNLNAGNNKVGFGVEFLF